MMKKEIEKKVQDNKNKVNSIAEKGKHFDIRKRWTPFSNWKQWYINKYKSNESVLINMELNTGFHSSFLVKENDGAFEYFGKSYILDVTSKYWNIQAKYWCYDFHEDIALPIKREIDVKKIKETVEAYYGNNEIIHALNPARLKQFIVSKILEQIMKGAAIEQWMRTMLIMAIVTMIAVIAHLLLFMQKTGMFSHIKIPGLTG